jgi:hypothetical protein
MIIHQKNAYPIHIASLRPASSRHQYSTMEDHRLSKHEQVPPVDRFHLFRYNPPVSVDRSTAEES